jgi:hypothetical protein
LWWEICGLGVKLQVKFLSVVELRLSVESVAQLNIWHANHFINRWIMFTMHEGCAAAAAADDVLLNFMFS